MLNNNRLSAITGSRATTYSYDAVGSGTHQYFIYGAGGLLAEQQGSWTQYIRLLDGTPLALIRSGQIHYIHTDHLGRPESVTNTAKTIVWQASNHAFDRTVTLDSIGGLNLGFPGQYHDAETGNWYNHHRTYNPRTGRYLESDPIGLAGGLNTYSYVGGNPVSWVDSLGLAKVDLSSGYTGRVDTFNYGGNVSFEIHVYDPRGTEVGVYGSDGWINKHGHRGTPRGLPDGVEAQCKTVSDDYSRRIGITARRASQGASRLKSIFKGWPLIEPLIEMTAPSPSRICEQIPDYPGCEVM